MILSLDKLAFTSKVPADMHIDLNSCFATLEQQANPFLRGRPIAVAAYNKDFGCIISPSVEAKRLGIRVGTRVKDAKLICPDIVVLEPDPEKYRFAHKILHKVFLKYTSSVVPRSIDEFVLNFDGMNKKLNDLVDDAQEIKHLINANLGCWVTVSIGIGPNRFLAKTAAGLHKPDGLDFIDNSNYLDVYRGLKLQDLCGIAHQNEARLNRVGINTVLDFYNSNPMILKRGFHSINGIYWYQRLRGYEVDNIQSKRQSFNNSYILPPGKKLASEVLPILAKLVEKMSFRMRSDGYKAKGIHLSVIFRKPDLYWHKGFSYKQPIFSSNDIYADMVRLFGECPYFEKRFVKLLAVTCYDLVSVDSAGGVLRQNDLFTDVLKKEHLVTAIDAVNTKWGKFIVSPAHMILAKGHVVDRIAFGK